MSVSPASTPPVPFIRPRHWLLAPLLALLTLPVWLGRFEPTLFYALNRALSVMPDLLWSLLSLLGTGWAVFALTSPALARAPRLLLAWLCAAPLAGALTRVGKAWAFSPRPLEVLGAQGVHVIGEPLYIAAMPSGHTITAFAAATAIYFSLAPPRRRRFLWLFALALGVALSRVAVGAHWPADVSVGAALGCFSGLVGAWIAGRLRAAWLRPDGWPACLAALFGLYCVYVLLSDPMGFAQNLPYQYLLAAFLLFQLARWAWRLRRARTGAGPAIKGETT